MFSARPIAIALVAAALSAPASAGKNVAEELSRINEQIALLSARLKELEVRAQIAAKQAEIERLGGGAVERTSEVPVVRAIEGVPGQLKATLAFGGAIQQTVAKGETTRGGWTVAEIGVNAVSLTRGKERIRLGFGNEPTPARPEGSGAGTSPGPAFPVYPPR